MDARRIIPIEVKDEYIIGAGRVIGAKGSHDDVALRAVFNDTWDGTSRTAVWLNALGENAVVQLLLPDTKEDGAYLIPIPEEAKSEVGEAMLTIKGFTTADGATEESATITATAYFRVLEGDFDQGASDSGSIALNQSEQFQAQLTALEADIVNAAKAADAKEAAESFANDAEGYAADADSAAQRAEAAAQRAEAAGGVDFKTDETLTLSPDGVLSVNTADKVGDKTLPITAAAVNVTVGNIEILLSQI